ncbi:hypothetical protein T11_17855 [Trichinella zimbabwensis]|uniref:Integrase catalytic domain-containing protein n=1 Tax=Trichinella zimbabwensis TaxID=268475 RepID=A0A0V1HVD0_9BILA|nr:hypothetical protein T11_17855 [Trichinella zimbabwensis]
MDFAGLRSMAGNQYTLVVVEYFTKWLAVFSLPNMEARTVAITLMERYVAYFGAPDQVHIDQG